MTLKYLMLALSVVGRLEAATLAVDCSSRAPLDHFWRSVGYTPAEFALRPDEHENTALLGAVPRRGITQVRIHYLFDLIEVLGFVPDSSTPSNFSLSYNWAALDHALDFIVANNLSPGFELMGSPMGFPYVPLSFWVPYSGNGKVQPAETFALWRALVGDTLIRYIERYGKSEVESWKNEAWNEPDSGWGWPKLANTSDPILDAYVSYWDATAAGLEDAEAATGAALKLGGTASGKAADDKFYLPRMLNHKAHDVNAFTGKPVRWDFITAHVKGESTSYVTVEGEWAVSALIRSKPEWVAAGLTALPISNDEGDPMVGWETPEDWRGDARYAAIIPKMVVQHLNGIADNATTNNPLGLFSFDGAFMNGVNDAYTGFGERTMTTRFGTTGVQAPTGFVRKNGLAAFTLLSLLGDERCTVGGVDADVLHANAGAVATAGSGDAAVLLYNSADCSDDTAPGVNATVTASGLPFAPAPADGSVVGVLYVVDNSPQRSAAATWAAQGSPALPSVEQLSALWAAAAAATAPAQAPLALAVGAGGSVALPPTFVPLPGLALWHVADRRAAPAAPPTPGAVTAWVKDPSASLFDGQAAEVFVRWDCSAAPRVVGGYVLQFSPAGVVGPWAVVNAPPFPSDTMCSFVHAAPPPPSGNPFTGAYRVAAVDYWGRQSVWTAPALALSWPQAPM